MIEKKLEKELELFLKSHNRSYLENSIEYSSLRQMKRRDGTYRKLHVVNFMVSISEQSYDGNGLYFATFDEKKYHLVEIVGPQSYEKIEE
ncbi:hypothetical protein [Chryseobacterium lathyri]|uniref:Uncharacterized protein n=1 Tax=Chryseobacterium lathyri TaxID=395933 RepID=A0ABT9SGW2_9FLAO|nr:hypothetical protein [Chryseobacterium lathyri]MDP9958658.1 hypothetical protein [Chryseobacterium lathyri]